MGDSQKRILTASLLGLVLIGAAFLSSQKNKAASQQNNFNSVAVLQRSHIPVTDSDNDGIPDWQAQLVEGPPVIITEATSSEYSIPDTLTAKSGIDFFKEVMTAEAYGVLDITQDEIVNNYVGRLKREAQDTLYRGSDVKTVAKNDAEFLRSYGNLVALVISNNQMGGETEYEIFTDAFSREDEERLKDLEKPYTDYEKIETELLDMTVPESYKDEHLSIINSFLALKNDVEGMQVLFEDPLYTFIRYKRYSSDVLGMSNAVTTLYGTLYLRDNVRYGEDEPVRQLVNYTD